MINKNYYLEKWKQMHCLENQKHGDECLSKCPCEYSYDTNLINCEEAIDYMR